MSQASTPQDALQGWDPRRRAALEQVWEHFHSAGTRGVSLSDELIAERHREADAEAASGSGASTPSRPSDTP